MKCPVCPTANLIMTERQGVEIDYCPECRGVWLDRGELDKIIERANAQTVAPSANGKESHYRSPEHLAQQKSYDHSTHHDHKGHGYGQGQPYKKKKSMLSELFDFD
jgi:hypothetical protein